MVANIVRPPGASPGPTKWDGQYKVESGEGCPLPSRGEVWRATEKNEIFLLSVLSELVWRLPCCDSLYVFILFQRILLPKLVNMHSCLKFLSQMYHRPITTQSLSISVSPTLKQAIGAYCSLLYGLFCTILLPVHTYRKVSNKSILITDSFLLVFGSKLGFSPLAKYWIQFLAHFDDVCTLGYNSAESEPISMKFGAL